MSMCFPLLRSRPPSKRTVVPAEPPPPPDPEPDVEQHPPRGPASRPSTSKEDQHLPESIVTSPEPISNPSPGNLSVDERIVLKTPPPPPPKPPSIVADMDALFDKNSAANKPEPELPSTDGLDYPRAASWSSCNATEILRDPLAKQVFRCFLFQALAEENMAFLEKLEEFKKMKSTDELQAAVAETMDSMGTYVNVSAPARAVSLFNSPF